MSPPCVNKSDVDFSVKDGVIYFGLAAIKGCGGSAGEAISSARKKGGPFRDLFDFCERVDSSGASKAVIETLIKAGAFDALEPSGRNWVPSLSGRSKPGKAWLRIAKAGKSRSLAPLRTTPQPNRRWPCPIFPVHPRTGPSRKRSARLLSVRPSAGRIQAGARHLPLAHHQRYRGRARAGRSHPRRHAGCVR